MVATAKMAEQLAAVRQRADQIGELVTEPRSESERELSAAPETSSADRRMAWFREIEDLVLDLSNLMPEGTEDHEAHMLFRFLTELRIAIEVDPEVADPKGDVVLASMKMRDVARRLGRRLEHESLDDPQAAVRAIFATLANISVGDLAQLLGVSTKTVNTWKSGGAVSRKIGRVVLLAQLLTYLRSSMTPVGVMMWFKAPRPQLEGQTPLELLDANEAAARDALVPLARGARGQLAS